MSEVIEGLTWTKDEKLPGIIHADYKQHKISVVPFGVHEYCAHVDGKEWTGTYSDNRQYTIVLAKRYINSKEGSYE